MALTVDAAALVPSDTVIVAAPIGTPLSVTVPVTRPSAGSSGTSTAADGWPAAIVTVEVEDNHPGRRR